MPSTSVATIKGEKELMVELMGMEESERMERAKSGDFQFLSESIIDFNDLALMDKEEAIEKGLENETCESKYFTHVYPRMETVLAMRRKGLSLKDTAHNLGVSPIALAKYAKKFPELRKVLLYGRLDAISQVENALFQKAMGFSRTVTKQKVTKEGDVVTVSDEQYYPPDTPAAIFIAKNMAPEDWHDKTETASTIDPPIKTMLADIGESEMKRRQQQREMPPLDPDMEVIVSPE